MQRPFKDLKLKIWPGFRGIYFLIIFFLHRKISVRIILDHIGVGKSVLSVCHKGTIFCQRYKGSPFLDLSKMVYKRVGIRLNFGAKPPHIKTMLSTPSFPSHCTLVMMVVHQ